MTTEPAESFATFTPETPSQGIPPAAVEIAEKGFADNIGYIVAGGASRFQRKRR